MKKIALCFLSAALLGLGALLLATFVGSTPSAENTSLLADLVYRVSSTPLAEPWLKRLAEELTSSSPVERHYLSQFTRRLSDIEHQTVERLADGSFQLVFPHTANGRGAGLVIVTSALVFNTTGSNAEGTIILRKQDGTAFDVSSNLGSGSEFAFTLGPGEVLRLETDGSGDLQTGWIEVLSNVPLAGSGTFAVFTTGGELLSEVGIGASPKSKQFMVFVDVTEGKNTGVALCNPDPESSILLDLRLASLDGSATIDTGELNLPARQQTAAFVTESFDVPADFKGLLIISSRDGSDFSVVTLRTRGVRFTSLQAAEEVLEDLGEEYATFIARIGDGVFGSLQFSTAFLLMNNSAQAASATLTVFAADGNPLLIDVGDSAASSFELMIPAGGAVELVSDGSNNPGAVGWAQVTSDSPIRGGATFTISDRASDQFISEVGVPAAQMTSRISIFAQVKGETNTGVGISNPIGFPLQLRARLLNLPGASAQRTRVRGTNTPTTLVAEKIVALGVNEHLGLFVSELFSEVEEVAKKDFEGILELRSVERGISDIFELPFAGITLRTRGTLLTSLPAAPFEIIYGPELSIDLATTLEGSSPAACFNITQQGNEFPLQTGVIEVDNIVFDYSKLEERPIIGNVDIEIGGTILSGPLFAANATENRADLDTLVSLDGIGEYTPFIASIADRAEGGVQIQVITNPIDFERLPITGVTRLCFESGLFTLPQGETDIFVQDASESYEERSYNAETVRRDFSSVLTTSALDANGPRVDKVEPTRVGPGDEIRISGGGFAANLSENLVTVEGNSRTQATVLSASDTELLVRLPAGVVSGDLLVEVEGSLSNPYALDIPFSPGGQIELGTLTAGSATTLSLRETQPVGQILIFGTTLSLTQGEWITGGFAEGQSIGRLSQRLILPDSQSDFLSASQNLIVRSSNANQLIIDVIPEDDDDPNLIITITNGGELTMEPPDVDLPAYAFLEVVSYLEFQVPIIRLPETPGSQFDMMVKWKSMELRPTRESTSFDAEKGFTFETE